MLFRTPERFVAGLALSLVYSLSVVFGQSTVTTETPSPTSTSTPAIPTPTPPASFSGVVSATTKGAILYHGGQLNVNYTKYSNELFSLDVTKPWKISFPIWTNLTTAISGTSPAVSGHSATMSLDMSTFIITAPTGEVNAPFLYGYNIKSQTWIAFENAVPVQGSIWAGRKESYFMTDPTSGAIWYIGGTLSNNVETNEIDKYVTGVGWNTNIPVAHAGSDPDNAGTTVMNRVGAGTSHLVGSKIFIFGGFSSSGPRTYQSFQTIPWIDISTATPTVGNQFTQGQFPQSRQDHCSILTASKKVILYGGYDTNSKTTFSDMWSLDLVTFTWQQIQPLNATSRRYGHNCNIVGANMIVFAGRASATATTTEIGYQGDVQVFDVTTSMWMTDYIPKDDNTPITQTTSGGARGFKSNNLGSGAIAGIAIGALAVMGAIIGAIIYRRRQKIIKTREAELEKQAYLKTIASDNETTDRNDGETASRRRHHRSQRSNRSNAYSSRTASMKRLNGTSTIAGSPGVSHTGMSGIESGQEDYYEEAPGNVQYLMQQLPDGSIAVQPVYLDHRSFQLQQSPNMAYSETSSLGGIIGRSHSITGRGSPKGRSSIPQMHSPTSTSISEVSEYVRPNSGITGQITFPPSTHDPFTSPSGLSREPTASFPHRRS